MIVADTNTLVYLALPSDFAPLADALYEKDQHWAAPVLWRSEFRNVLSLYLRKKLLTLEAAIAAFIQAETTIAANEYQVESREVLRLVEASGHTAYDCEFVALAQRLGVPLVTTDKKLLRAFPSVAISLADAAG